uniref:nuclear pore complex protein Nup85 isoform X3 n=1 Tax=Myxine glutinosa TaxID=7769 RepID=UPI00358E23D3
MDASWSWSLQHQLPHQLQHFWLVAFSRNYRSVMKDCMEEIQNVLSSNQNHQGENELANQISQLSALELIWHLCEVLFMESLQMGHLLPMLLDWVRLHSSALDQMAEDVTQSNCPAEHSDYWDVVCGFVLQARMQEARKLLAQSIIPDGECSMYAAMDELLRTMPHYVAGHTFTEFELKWKYWHDECERLLSEGAFPHCQLRLLCKILLGDAKALLGKKHLMPWYHFLVAKLLFNNPTVKIGEVHNYVQPCLDLYGCGREMEPLDQILQVAFDLNYNQVIKDCSLTLSSWWFVSHLADLLHRCPQFQLGSDLREFLLFEYATDLLSHHSLWSLAPAYLDTCGESGRACLELCLVRLPLQSEKKAQKVLRLCRERGMQDQERSICKQMAMKALRSGRLGSALAWSLRAKDSAFATRIADRFLEDYRSYGFLPHLDLIDSLGPSMLVSDRLTFLAKYREFHRLYSENHYKEAAQLLLSLMMARVAPRYFWLNLMTDALPLLTQEKVVFTSQQCYRLLECLQEIVTERNKESAMNEDAQAEDIIIIREAIASNHARTVIQERTEKVL